MADSPISGLPVTTTLGDNDRLLLEQGNTAKQISGETLKDYFNANVVSADASAIDPTDPPEATFDINTGNLHLDLPTGDYFVSCTLTGTDGNKSIYTLTSALGHTVTFEVMNGTGGAPSDTAPLALGTASAGIDPEYSRADHVHPKPSAADVGALARLGTIANVNPQTDLNDFVTGIGLFNDYNGTTVDHFPYNASTETAWAFVLSAGNGSNTASQLAFDIWNGYSSRERHLTSGTWSAWADMKASATALNGAVPVAHGGTGGTSAATARSNLGVHQFSVQSVSVDDMEINASTFTSFNITTARTGYTPVGIVGFSIENATNGGSGNTQCMSNRIYLNSSGNVVWWIRNISASAVKIKATAYILYSKND